MSRRDTGCGKTTLSETLAAWVVWSSCYSVVHVCTKLLMMLVQPLEG